MDNRRTVWELDTPTKDILKVLVGSRANGLFREDSDYDYRGVFVQQTRSTLSVNGTTKTTNWIEGEVDNTSYEIGHFVHLALQCNPFILEVFVAPVVPNGLTQEGQTLRGMFKAFLDTKRIEASFCGYGYNQRKKFLEDKDERPWKYAVAWLRTLLNAEVLLRTGTFDIRVPDSHIGELAAIRDGKWTKGGVIDKTLYLEERVHYAARHNEWKQDVEAVNEFLLAVRRGNW